MVIEIKNLTKIYGNAPEKAIPLIEKGWCREKIREETEQNVALRNVSLSITGGKIHVVMGLSGSGKSTLIRCINRLVEPTAGEIWVNGENILLYTQEQLRRLRHKLGMVFQKFALFPHFTVKENCEYGLEIQGIAPEERSAKAYKALQLVGLTKWMDVYPHALSGGMQQRVGLARALALDPEFLLMDEAFSSLDPLTRREMQEELLELQRRMKKTILFISHDLDEATRLGDTILFIKDGEIIQTGNPEEIINNPSTRYIERFVAEYDPSKMETKNSQALEI